MVVDYLIIGQGICGSFLSWNLVNAGKRVLVIDEADPASATRVSGGVINPVTGRKLVTTWMIDELMAAARQEYRAFEQMLQTELLQECSILQFHASPQMRDAFTDRYGSNPQFLATANENEWRQYFSFNYGVGSIAPAFRVRLNDLVNGWRRKLQEKESLLAERFDLHKFSFTPAQVVYGDVTATKAIFCNGTGAATLPFFAALPFANNKGQAILAEIPGLPPNHIYKHGMTIVPWKDEVFWIGSSYEWNYPDVKPGAAFRQQVELQLQVWLKLPYRIIDHVAAERPATLERRPFVGIHPQHPSLAILNGMGTKGCSLAPYFARELSQHLLQGRPITPAADVQRFRGVFNRQFS